MPPVEVQRPLEPWLPVGISSPSKQRRSGGTYFFHRNLLERSGNDLLVRDIDHLRDAVRQVRINHPFTIRAWIVLPDHLHCVIDLPSGDTDFCDTLSLDHCCFFPNPFPKLTLSAVRLRRGDCAIWQRRYWEHLIRDERDFAAHMDYVHINPLKHGLGKHVADRPFF
ncbi:transposase [Undibacterium arcticum]